MKKAKLIPIFHHIQKAAGSYIREVFRSSIGRDHRIPFGARPEDPRHYLKVKPGLSLYSSHYSYHPDHFTPDPGMFYFTWVRDPADMLYSAYQFYGSRTQRPHANFKPDDMGQVIKKVHKYKDHKRYIDAFLDGQQMFPQGFLDLPYEKFDFVGHASHMERDIGRLGDKLGITLIPLKERVNVSDGERIDRQYRRPAVIEKLQPEYQQLEVAVLK